MTDRPAILDAEAVVRHLPWPRAVAAMRAGFTLGASTPDRHHHRLPRQGEPDGTLLLMPAWTSASPATGSADATGSLPPLLGVKIATVLPGNADRGLGAVQAVYVLQDAVTGRSLAVLDGLALTLRRTAAASALAADLLARPDARRLLVVGTGNLAPCLAEAHASVRNLDDVAVWGRRRERAERTVEKLRAAGLSATVAGDLEAACRAADIVSCATLAESPLVHGAWLAPGCHLDLVGSFRPDLREADDEAVRRASVWIDTAVALEESGDLLGPLESGALRADDVRGDLADLVRVGGGRRTADEITLFKSVGTALEDLHAAAAVYRSFTDSSPTLS